MSTDEIIQLVNLNDQIIGRKLRNQLTDDDCWRIISLWVTDSKDNILLQQRSLDKKVFPGIWTAAVEGTVDYGDNYTTTATREAEEEIGLTNLGIQKTKKYYGPWGNFGKRQCQGFAAIYSGDKAKIKKQDSEVENLKWFTLPEVHELHSRTPDLFPLFNIYKKLGFIK